ncbi:MAG: tRNA 2-thiocytidine biosynthesis protein TtcA [Eubacteriales bacterium]|nr:tRNA 2-thiocytidine biosynthesis protein TtcA [Eubacteriales bacterium]MDN5364748.1 tRNA 2-thiocytidine biosynthesis protein TtcA [Eubacteriales bacterium]
MKLPAKLSRKIWRAIIEFDLLQPGDRILVGLSGGKDSSFLLYALRVVRDHAPFPLEVGALTVDLGFSPDFDPAPLEDYCRRLGVPFYFRRAVLPGVEEAVKGNKAPCAACAYFRRGIMNNFAREAGYNKVALAHHYDDAVETFLMSQIYSGQLKTLPPKSYLKRTGVTVIRPLIYLREKDIREGKKLTGFTPIPSPCPFDGRTKRQVVKELIASLSAGGKHRVFANLAAAMRQGSHVDLWPPEPDRKELERKVKAFWRGAKIEEKKDEEALG